MRIQQTTNIETKNQLNLHAKTIHIPQRLNFGIWNFYIGILKNLFLIFLLFQHIRSRLIKRNSFIY